MRTAFLLLSFFVTLSFGRAADSSSSLTTQPPVFEFRAYEGDPRQPEKMDFQISFADGKPSAFVQLGQGFHSSGTLYTLKSFRHKTLPHATLGTEDVSELTVVNSKTGKDLVLVLPPVKELGRSKAP